MYCYCDLCAVCVVMCCLFLFTGGAMSLAARAKDFHYNKDKQYEEAQQTNRSKQTINQTDNHSNNKKKNNNNDNNDKFP